MNPTAPKKINKETILRTIQFVGFYSVDPSWAQHQERFKLLKQMVNEGSLEEFSREKNKVFFRKAKEKPPTEWGIYVNGVLVEPISAKFDSNFNQPHKYRTSRKAKISPVRVS